MSIVNLYGQDAAGNIVPVRVDPLGGLFGAVPPVTWSYAAALGGILNTTGATTLVPPNGTAQRSYIAAIQLSSDVLTVATEVVVRDGPGGPVLWRTKIGTAGLLNGMSVNFNTPLRSSANTLLEVATITATVAGAVYFNAQGYISSI